MKKSICILTLVITSLTLSSQGYTPCLSADLSVKTIAQLDTLFDLSLSADQYPCGIKIFETLLQKKRNLPKDKLRAGYCYLKMKMYSKAKDTLERALNPQAPAQFNYYFYGEAILGLNNDREQATKAFLNELRFHKNSTIAYHRLDTILLAAGDYLNLIEAEKLSDFDDQNEDLRIGYYYLQLKNNQKAMSHFNTACDKGNPEACYSCYLYSDTAKITERISYLKRCITNYNSNYEQLSRYYQPQSGMSVDDTWIKNIKNEYSTNLAQTYLMLALEYLKIDNRTESLNCADNAILTAVGTTDETLFFDKAAEIFKKLNVSDKLLLYKQNTIDLDKSYGNSGSKKALTESEETISELFEATKLLDSIASLQPELLSSNLLTRVLQKYDLLGATEEYDQLVNYMELKREARKLLRFNFTNTTHYSKTSSKRYDTYRKNISESDYLNKDSLSLDELVSLFLMDYDAEFSKKSLSGALKELRNLRDAIKTRKDELSPEIEAWLFFKEGLAYNSLDNSTNHCETAQSLFSKAVAKNPSLQKVVDGISCKKT